MVTRCEVDTHLEELEFPELTLVRPKVILWILANLRDEAVDFYRLLCMGTVPQVKPAINITLLRARPAS